MSTAASDRAAAIFFALSQVPPEQRDALLDERCGGDRALRAEVERLLAGLDLSDSFVSPAGVRPPAERDGASQPAGTVIGDFVVVRQIGAGGTGVVHLAHQRHPPRVVALKVLRREFVASAVQRRFEIEAELLAHLHHPGIAQIYAAHPGDETTPPFIAMELVSGPPLTEFADTHRLSLRDRVELMAQVGDAVQHAHQRGIIHRDLKPGNILVNEHGQPKVLDFGVARRFDAPVSSTTIATETGQLVGTLAYMSPEQVQAIPEAIDTRTDIHALGVMLFRLLAGRLPFGHDDPPLPELARRIVQEDAPRLGAIDPSLRGDVEIIVARALAKEKERRYASAAALTTDLRRYLAGQPISASADSAWYVVRRQLGRYRLAVALAAATLVIVSGLAFYANLQRTRADQTNVRLQTQLAASMIERGRLLTQSGNHPIAEELVWRELFRRPDSRHAQWTLWDLYSREPSAWVRIEHQGGTQTLRFSPDNRWLVTAGRLDGLMHLLDAETGSLVRTLTTNPRSGTRRALFTADSKSIIAGTQDGAIRVWDVATGELRREFLGAIPRLHDFAMAADGVHLVTVAWGEVIVWSLATGQRVTDFSGLVTPIYVAATTPAGTIAITGADDGTVTAVDFARRVRLWSVSGHTGQVRSLAVSPDGRVVASGGADSIIRLWSMENGAPIRSIDTENEAVRNLSFDGSGAMLVAAGVWKTRMWNLRDPLQPGRDLGASEGVTEALIRPDGRALATCDGGSGRVRMWDLAADPRTDHWAAHPQSVFGLLVDRDSGSVVSGSLDGLLSRWHPDRPDRDLIVDWRNRIHAFDLSRNRRWLAIVGPPGSSGIWDMRDGRRVADLPNPRASRAVLFAAGDRRVLVGMSDGSLMTWDVSDGVPTNGRLRPPTPGEILSLATDGTRAYLGHTSHTIDVVDVESGQQIRQIEATASPVSLAASPDGRLLAAGTFTGTVDLWETASGRRLESLKGQTALVAGLDFSPDGTMLAVSSRDGSTRLWDIAANQFLATVGSRKPGAERVRFFPDGRRLAIGYRDGEIEIRDLQYFFRHAAGSAEYQLQLFRKSGESFPRADEVLAWSRGVLSGR